MKNIRRCVMSAFAGLALLMPALAAADQNDPQLDILFAELQSTDDPAEGQTITEDIWNIWINIADEQLQDIMNRGRMAMALGNRVQALAIFDQLVAAAPDYAEAWNKRATVYFFLGQFDASAADVERVLALEPRHFGALSGLGHIGLAHADPAAALEAYEAALAMNPHLPGMRQQIDAIRRRLEGERL